MSYETKNIRNICLLGHGGDGKSALCESVAELSEDLMERYFAGEEFSDEELIAGIRQGVKDLVLAPVFCGTAATGIGTVATLKGICDYMPSPDQGEVEVCEEGDDLVEIPCNPNGTPCSPSIRIKSRSIFCGSSRESISTNRKTIASRFCT